MNFENFVSVNFILSFSGMVILVNILTQFTKELFDNIFSHVSTKFVAYGYSLLLCVFAVLLTGKFTTAGDALETILFWLINSVIIWLTAMKGYETVIVKK